MGRNKIKIEKITNERNRHATFTKRKNGLFKKAMELSILCDCDIALVIVNSNDKYYQYSSGDIDEILKKRLESEYPSQSFSNKDYAVSFISKKQEDEFEEKEFDHDERDYYPTKSSANSSNSPSHRHTDKSSASHTPPPQAQPQQQQQQQAPVQQVPQQQSPPVKSEIFDPNFAPPHNELPLSPNEWRGRGDQRSPQYPFQGAPERRDYPSYAYPTNYRPGSSYNIVAIPYNGGVYPYPHYPYGSPGQFNQPYMNPYQVHASQPGEVTELAPDQKLRPDEVDNAGRAQFLAPLMPSQQRIKHEGEADGEHPTDEQYQYVKREEAESQLMPHATNNNHSNGATPSASPPHSDLDRKLPLNGHQMPPVFDAPSNGQTMMRGSAGLGVGGPRKNGSPTLLSSHLPTAMGAPSQALAASGRSNSFYNTPQGRADSVPSSLAMEEDIESKKTGRPEEKNDSIGSTSKRPKLSIQIPSDSNGFESSISENYRKSPKSPSAFVSISPISFRPHQESLKFDVPFDFVASPFSYEMKSPKFPQELTNPFLQISSLQEKKSSSS